ncbi:hypothetical protein HMPREF3226_01287 [Prevotella corporis]|uniref:Uncharacterized protein n=1 Tax=Prevotella corporis TaxID=28128 RepID=A0A133Q991_9BACT|nr:hypothetical protein HMPREF3226_01287 [Prevotella corporis]
MAKQDRNTEKFERGDRYQLDIDTVADAFGHRGADAQARIGTRTAADGYGIDWNSVAVGKRQGLIDERSKTLTVIRTTVIFLFVDACAIFTQGNGAHIGACFYVQYTRHNSFLYL